MEYIQRKRILFLGLPWTFTKYIVSEDMITVQEGLLKQVENDCYIYKVQDVSLQTSLWERIFKLGTVVCHTSDVTSPRLVLTHIREAKEIKNYILEKSEAARIKRRTVNMLDIGVADMEE